MTEEIEIILHNALREDIGEGDISCKYFVNKKNVEAYVCCDENNIVLSAVEIIGEVFKLIDPELEIEVLKENGDFLNKGDKILKIKGNIQSILTGENTTLSFVNRMSGIATFIKNHVDKIKMLGLKTQILDTRNMTPGLRVLEKAAVRHGGGRNHRMGLYDMAYVKDCSNLLELALNIGNFRKDCKNMALECEATSEQQVKDLLSITGVDIIFLNMPIDEIRESMLLRGDKDVLFEAKFNNLDDLAKTGVDIISVDTENVIPAKFILEIFA